MLYRRLIATTLASCSLGLINPGWAGTPRLEKLEHLKSLGARVSALAVDLTTGHVMGQLTQTQRLAPASISKLVIGAQALSAWGPDKTFTSRLAQRGTRVGSTLNGDVVFYGEGDPSLTNEKLWFLTSDVARAGIREITGKIIINNGFFGTLEPDETRQAGRAHSQHAYDAPLSSAAVNFSVLAVVVTPGLRSGDKAIVSFEPFSLPSLQLINEVTTTANGDAAQLFVTRRSTQTHDVFTVQGHVPLGHPAQRIYRSISKADRYTGEVIQAFLTAANVKTSGQIEYESTPPRLGDIPIAQIEGPTLGWQLRGLFGMSNNFIADILALHFPKDAGITYLQRLGRTQNPQNPMVLHSGSGLTPENRLSAEDVVMLLKTVYQSSFFPEYLAALATPGSVGTLSHRLRTPDHPHFLLRAKTGTLTEPQLVVALAGYSKLQNDHWVAFAVLVNTPPKNKTFDVVHLQMAIDADIQKLFLGEL